MQYALYVVPVYIIFRYEREVDQKSEELSNLKGSKANILLKLQELTLKVSGLCLHNIKICFLLFFIFISILCGQWIKQAFCKELTS